MDIAHQIVKDHPYFASTTAGHRCVGCDEPIVSIDGSFTAAWSLHIAEETAQRVSETSRCQDTAEQAWDRLCNWLAAHDETDVRPSVVTAARGSNPYRGELDG